MSHASASTREQCIDGKQVGWTMRLHLPVTDTPTPAPDNVPDIVPVEEPPIDEPPMSDPPAVEEPTPSDTPKLVRTWRTASRRRGSS